MDEGTYERLSFGLSEEAENEPDLDEDEIPEPTQEELTGMEADPNKPLTPPAASFAFGPQENRPNMDAAEARRRLMNRLEIMVQSNRTDLTFDDLADLPEEVGKTPGWVYNQLKLLVEAGVLKMYKPPKGKAIYSILRKFQDSSTG
jgi:hypothetical protein